MKEKELLVLKRLLLKFKVRLLPLGRFCTSELSK